jgi:hypothetical protein
MASILVSSKIVPMLTGFIMKSPCKKSGVYSCWTGFLAARILFILFETIGEYNSDLATQTL